MIPTNEPAEPTWASPDGRIRLFHGDFLNLVERIGKIDAFITDPPYSSGGMFRGDRAQSTRTKYQSTDAQVEHDEFSGDNRDQRSFMIWMTMWLIQVQEILNSGGACCLFTDWRQIPAMTDALQCGGFIWRGIVPWDKVNSRPMANRFRAQCEYMVWGTNGGREVDMANAVYLPGILRETPPMNAERVHYTQKPVGIMRTILQIAPRDGIVLDPFMGSGTTGVAAAQTGRRFVGIEKNRDIFDKAVIRIKDALLQPEFDLGDDKPQRTEGAANASQEELGIG